MPEPNLPPLRLNLSQKASNHCDILNVEDFKKSMPKLPCEVRQEMMQNFNFPLELVVRLYNEPELLEHFKNCQKVNMDIKSQSNLAHLILLDVPNFCTKANVPLENCITSELLIEASNLKVDNVITKKLQLKGLECLISGEDYPTFQNLLESKGWLLEFRNEDLINSTIDEVLKENAKLARKFIQSGKPKLLTQLLGEVSKKNDLLDSAIIRAKLENKVNK